VESDYAGKPVKIESLAALCFIPLADFGQNAPIPGVDRHVCVMDGTALIVFTARAPSSEEGCTRSNISRMPTRMCMQHGEASCSRKKSTTC
jgi:hypothetical protein